MALILILLSMKMLTVESQQPPLDATLFRGNFYKDRVNNSLFTFTFEEGQTLNNNDCPFSISDPNIPFLFNDCSITHDKSDLKVWASLPFNPLYAKWIGNAPGLELISPNANPFIPRAWSFHDISNLLPYIKTANAFTFEFWIQTLDVLGTSSIFGFNHQLPPTPNNINCNRDIDAFYVGQNPHTLINYDINGGVQNTRYCIYNRYPFTESIFHFVITIDSSSSSTYINGEFQDSSTLTGNYDYWNDSSHLYMGPWSGRIFEMSLYNFSFTGSQILQNFNAGLPNILPQPVYPYQSFTVDSNILTIININFTSNDLNINDTLHIYLTSLPSSGQLYYFNNVNNVPINNLQNDVPIWIPILDYPLLLNSSSLFAYKSLRNQYGYNVTSFSFTPNDGKHNGRVGQVFININLPPPIIPALNISTFEVQSVTFTFPIIPLMSNNVKNNYPPFIKSIMIDTLPMYGSLYINDNIVTKNNLPLIILIDNNYHNNDNNNISYTPYPITDNLITNMINNGDHNNVFPLIDSFTYTLNMTNIIPPLLTSLSETAIIYINQGLYTNNNIIPLLITEGKFNDTVPIIFKYGQFHIDNQLSPPPLSNIRLVITKLPIYGKLLMGSNGTMITNLNDITTRNYSELTSFRYLYYMNPMNLTVNNETILTTSCLSIPIDTFSYYIHYAYSSFIASNISTVTFMSTYYHCRPKITMNTNLVTTLILSSIPNLLLSYNDSSSYDPMINNNNKDPMVIMTINTDAEIDCDLFPHAKPPIYKSDPVLLSYLITTFSNALFNVFQPITLVKIQVMNSVYQINSSPLVITFVAKDPSNIPTRSPYLDGNNSNASNLNLIVTILYISIPVLILICLIYSCYRRRKNAENQKRLQEEIFKKLEIMTTPKNKKEGREEENFIKILSEGDQQQDPTTNKINLNDNLIELTEYTFNPLSMSNPSTLSMNNNNNINNTPFGNERQSNINILTPSLMANGEPRESNNVDGPSMLTRLNNNHLVFSLTPHGLVPMIIRASPTKDHQQQDQPNNQESINHKRHDQYNEPLPVIRTSSHTESHFNEGKAVNESKRMGSNRNDLLPNSNERADKQIDGFGEGGGDEIVEARSDDKENGLRVARRINLKYMYPDDAPS